LSNLIGATGLIYGGCFWGGVEAFSDKQGCGGRLVKRGSYPEFGSFRVSPVAAIQIEGACGDDAVLCQRQVGGADAGGRRSGIGYRLRLGRTCRSDEDAREGWNNQLPGPTQLVSVPPLSLDPPSVFLMSCS